MQLSGIFPPIITPFTKDDELDTRGLRENTRRWMTTGLAGIVTLGTNGESAYVDDDEADRIVAMVREEVPRQKLLIAGTGRDSTRATIAATRRAASAGADAVLVRTPSFFKSQMTAAAFVRHYRAVADASPVPVLLYNFPAGFGVDLPGAAIEQLATHPNILGIKQSGGDLGKIADDVALARSLSKPFYVMCGAAPILHAAVLAGAAGGILAAACAVPEICVELFELARAGRHDDARDLQRRLTPLAKAVTSGFGVPGLKAALDLVGYTGGAPRSPLAPATPEAVAALREQLQALGVVAVTRA
jgi:4-hydroxy-2-oxoglutarate aldolase